MLTIDDLRYETSLFSLADYLKNNDNYSIYHSLDDFFTNKNQIAKLKNITGKHLVALSNGSHLGFLYRKEFLDALKRDVEGGNKGF